MAVSYTHLDVYKRQVCKGISVGVDIEKIQKISDRIVNKSVSYTHLDVYKRKVFALHRY